MDNIFKWTGTAWTNRVKNIFLNIFDLYKCIFVPLIVIIIHVLAPFNFVKPIRALADQGKPLIENEARGRSSLKSMEEKC